MASRRSAAAAAASTAAICVVFVGHGLSEPFGPAAAAATAAAAAPSAIGSLCGGAPQRVGQGVGQADLGVAVACRDLRTWIKQGEGRESALLHETHNCSQGQQNSRLSLF